MSTTAKSTANHSNKLHTSCPGDALLGSSPAPVQSPPPDVHTTRFGMHLRAAAQVVLGGVLPVEVAGEAGPCFKGVVGGTTKDSTKFPRWVIWSSHWRSWYFLLGTGLDTGLYGEGMLTARQRWTELIRRKVATNSTLHLIPIYIYIYNKQVMSRHHN